MKRWTVVSLVGIALLVVLLLGWFVLASPDPQVTKVQQLQKQLFEQGDKMTPESRAQLREDLRAESESLTETQRRELRGTMREQFRERMVQRVHEFNQLDEGERIAFLDREIDRMESRRDGSRRRGPRGSRDTSDAAREQRRRSRLDNSTPQQRAEFAVFIEAMRQRREERGLSNGSGPPWGR